MFFPMNFEVDVKHYIDLIEEQGTDATKLRSEFDEITKTIPEKERIISKKWHDFTKKVMETESKSKTNEPSDYNDICNARPARRILKYDVSIDPLLLREKIEGGIKGRIAGCILGKPVECLMGEKDSTAKLKEILTDTGEYPLKDFVPSKTMDLYWKKKGNAPSWYNCGNSSLRENLKFAPADDDLNYTVISLKIIKEKGLNFIPDDVLDTWLRYFPYGAVCTAEKAAYKNRVMGMAYPDTAIFNNPYKEWIGAQIRTDYYGYICPADPQEAARMAWNDAACSHIKNGIYGAMWVSAAIASAVFEKDSEAVINRGLEMVPDDCRFTFYMKKTVETAKRNGTDYEKTFADIKKWIGNYHCVHTINNACVVAAALMHGGADFEKVITIAVMGGLDTDCNGATAGSIAGVMLGAKNIPDKWIRPFNNTLRTSISGSQEIKISDFVDETVKIAQDRLSEKKV
jgi:ADP-ribosylglycohydrolase